MVPFFAESDQATLFTFVWMYWLDALQLCCINKQGCCSQNSLKVYVVESIICSTTFVFADLSLLVDLIPFTVEYLLSVYYSIGLCSNE
jgi:hypothetical protein